MKNVILLGGGIDSTTLLIYLKKVKIGNDLAGFHINYGQKAWDSEKEANRYFGNKYGITIFQGVVDLHNYSSSGILKGAMVEVENKLEGRNIVLMSMAGVFAKHHGADSVYVGFHKEPKAKPFPDATMETLEKMKAVFQFSYGHSPLLLKAPFLGMTRLEIFKLGVALDPEILSKTFTCYEGGEKECGVCAHCKTKAQMMEQL